MNTFSLSLANWKHYFKEHLLTIILISVSISVILVSLHLNQQIQKKFEDNLAGIDMIVAAKGSPLQIMLSSMYHIDAPTGNIPINKVKAFLRPGHPYIENAVPLGLGDSYRNYRIIGTTQSFDSLYDIRVETGRNRSAHSEVVIGHEVAVNLDLKPGDKIQSAHGYNMEDMVHDHDLEVVGILAKQGNITDQLILTNIQTIWEVHGDHLHDNTAVSKNSDLLEYEDKSITSILIDFKGRNMQTLKWPRQINSNTNLQAVTPAQEAARLYDTMGRVGSIGVWLGRGLVAIALLSLMVSLFLSFEKRVKSLSILRMIGAGKWSRILVTILESFWTILLGIIAGFLLAHTAIYLLSGVFYENYKVYMDAFMIADGELSIILVFLILGLLASVVPAWRAARGEIGRLIG